ncbi:CRISPR-associated endonuclease Cas1 [Thioalkalivibrio sp. ALE11]|uniref:CRISPR-associated endonuclease Cas1 n=1 Tax=Thioalkalivibrio sp. ALE11 TaxID=1265494 RepID=UPI00035DA9D7|nr:CRISPR-associated endonuclease Cas1 [Thioalkalivibrio sp. ALE11]
MPIDGNDRIPLYVTPGIQRVARRDPGLYLQHADGRSMQIPVARISRVISPVSVPWDHSALMLTIEQGVSVHWINRDGEVTGRLLPQTPAALSREALVDQFLGHADWRERLDAWAISRRDSQLREWQQRRTLNPRVHPARARREYVHRGEHPNFFPIDARPWTSAWVASTLLQDGFPLQRPADADGTFDLCETLAPQLWAELNLGSGSLIEQQDDDFSLLHFFEVWTRQHHLTLTEAVRSLGRLLHQS